jgi:hypothetical protein
MNINSLAAEIILKPETWQYQNIESSGKVCGSGTRLM